MLIHKSLVNVSYTILYNAFLEAFRDYPVDLHLSFQEFFHMLERRGFNREKSIGIFETSNGVLAGFMMNGCREWNGEITAYDLATGVIPEYRGKGLSKRMFSALKKELKQEKTGQYLLEVIKSNTPALELYKSQKFIVQREFSVFTLSEKYKEIEIEKAFNYRIDTLLPLTFGDWKKVKEYWDFTPSWQNSTDSIIAADGQFYFVTFRYGRSIIAYGFIDPKTGDIPQFAVSLKYRKRGLGTHLLSLLIEASKTTEVRVANIEDCKNSEGMKALLRKFGFEQTSAQYEMLLILDNDIIKKQKQEERERKKKEREEEKLRIKELKDAEKEAAERKKFEERQRRLEEIIYGNREI